MNARRLAVVASTVFTLSMGLISAGASTAAAAPPTTDIGIMTVRVMNHYPTERDCRIVQNEFRRYYQIVRTCYFNSGEGWGFHYKLPK